MVHLHFLKSGHKRVLISAKSIYRDVSFLIKTMYDDLEATKNKGISKSINIYILFSAIATKAIKILKTDTVEYKAFKRNIEEMMQNVKNDTNINYFMGSSILLSCSDDVNNLIKINCNSDGLDDKDVEMIFEKLVNEEQVKENKKIFISNICTNKKSLDYALKLGYITLEDIDEALDLEEIKNIFIIAKGTEYLLNYVSPNKCISLYKLGVINEKQLKKHATINDIFESTDINKDDILYILLSKKVYNLQATKQLWRLYEKGEFSLKEMQLLTDNGNINPLSVIDNYLEEQKRKISLELKEKQNASEEKLLEYFNPNQVLSILEKCNEGKTVNFFRDDLKKIYNDAGRNLSQELIETEKKNEHKDENELKDNLLNLYKLGITSLDEFSKTDFSEDDILKLYSLNGGNDEVLIDGYNAGFISQETILITFDEEEIFEQIKKGLNPSILSGYYGTVELFDLYKSGEISMENIVDLKDNIDTNKLQELYNSDELSYEELFELSKRGVITEDEAKKINDEYDIADGLKRLAEKGGITGIDVDLYRENGDVDRVIGPDNRIIPVDPVIHNLNNEIPKIDEGVKMQLFESLGAGDRVRVNCKLFDGYVMIPFIEKKLAVLEGEGRTYILPIKVVLEQVEHRGSENDLIGNATYKKDLYKNTEYVRTVYHTSNWGKKLIERMHELNNDVDSEELLEENKEILNEIAKSYKVNKEKRKR